MASKNYDFHFHRKSSASGAVIIEGFSNKNVPDRIKERMDPKGGRFDNYKKNPVVLFDHGKDPAFGVMPVGKGLVIEPQEQGVYTKVRISNSKTEKISVVRDLVEEDILKTFSLGYETFNESKDADGVTVLTDWELLEQSIVPVPMNQDSIFTMAKRYERSGNDFGCKYLERAGLLNKGALVAAAVHKRVCDMKANRTLTDCDKALAQIADLSGHKVGEVKEFMMGDRHGTPRLFKAIATVLGVSEQELTNIRATEVLMAKKKGAKSEEEKNTTPDVKADPPKEEEKPGEKPPEEKPEEEKPKEEEPKAMVLHSISVPKAMYDDPENAKSFVEAHGFKAEKMDEDDECYKFEQNSAEGLDMSKAMTIDMGDGVTGVAAPRAAKAKPEEETKPAEDTKPEEEKPEDQKEAATPQDLLRQALEVGDNHDRARQLVQQALTMLGDGKGGEKAAPMPSGADAVQGDENPYLIAARQTNVLLGTLIQEIQKLGQKFEGQGGSPKPTEQPPQEDPEASKRLASLRDYQQNIDVRLKRLGV